MNIIKLQNDLKSVPDQALIGYVQNPNGQVPSYLALSELQRRKEMRDSYQKNQASQTTVADDLEQASSGLASLAPQQPQAPMPQAPVQGMAYGGAVHFADGGSATADDVKDASNLDNLPTLNLDTGESRFSPDSNSYLNSDWYKRLSAMADMGLSGIPAGLDRPARFGGETLFGGKSMGQAINDAINKTHHIPGSMAQGGEVHYAPGGRIAGPVPTPINTKPSTAPVTTSPAPTAIGRKGITALTPTPTPTPTPVITPTPTPVVPTPVTPAPSMVTPINTLPSNPTQLYTSTTPMTPSGYSITPGAPIQLYAEGGVASLDTGDMYDENNYATGGIVAFANGGSTLDEYGIQMPTGATLDDISMEMQESNRLYGVDPQFYAKQAQELQKQRDELAADKTQAGWMGLARAGLGMAAGTSPFALKNISEGALQGVTQYGADIKDIKAQDRLLKQADMKLAEAQQAEARGDARTSMKLMDERNNKLLDAQLKRAEIGIKDKIAAAKASGDTNKAEALLKYHAAQLGEQKFVNAYPSGSVSGYLGDNQALTEFIRNKYTKSMEDYLRTGVLKDPPSEADIKKEFEKLYPNKAPGAKASSSKPAATKPAVTKPEARPPQINNLLNKYPPKNTSSVAVPQKRSTNTPEELELNRRLEYFNQYPPSEGQTDEDEEV